MDRRSEIPETIRALAEAVLDGDLIPAYVLLDALEDYRVSGMPLTNLLNAEKEFNERSPDSGWPVRVLKVFRRYGVETLTKLLQLSELDLLEFKNFGVTSLAWVAKWLARHNLRLRA